jgi:hypothetical protein
MREPEHLQGEGDRRASRPARASAHARTPRTRRRGHGDTDRPAGAQHIRPVRHRQRIVDAKAQLRSLAEPWADTGTSTGRLMIAVLGGWPTVERDLIRTRTAEGRSRAQKRGQRMGRKPKLTEAQQAEARKRRAEGATLRRTGAQLRRGEEHDFTSIIAINYRLLWSASSRNPAGGPGVGARVFDIGAEDGAHQDSEPEKISYERSGSLRTRPQCASRAQTFLARLAAD